MHVRYLIYVSSLTDSRVGATDLRLKLQKRSIQKATHTGNGSAHIRDLREKLSGTVYSQPAEAARAKPRVATEGTKPLRKSVVTEASVPETKKVNNTVSKKKAEQKVRLYQFHPIL